MRNRAVRLAMVVFVFTAAMFAQNMSSSTPSREEVMKLLELTQARQNMLVAIESMKTQMKAGAQQALRMKLPDATPQQVARFEKAIDASFADFPADEIFDAIIPVYQRHLAKDDLDGLIAFYSTPLGQRVIREMPALLSESMQAGAEVARTRMSVTMKQVDEQIEKMQQEEMNSNHGSHPEKKKN